MNKKLNHLERRRARQLAASVRQRAMASLALFQPTPQQDEFLKDTTQQRLLRKGNRVGGSLVCAVELARAALGRDPHNKYPQPPLRIYTLQYSEDNIGRVTYNLLCRAGSFYIIEDEKTGEWRTYRPWTDAHRFDERKPAPPLIPPREIATIAWENKATNQFRIIRLKNGTEIFAYSSGSDPSIATGAPFHLIWIDEDLVRPDWIPEMQRGLSDYKGKLIWSAKPLVHNAAMLQLSERAAHEATMEKPGVREHRLTFTENPYIDAEEKENRRRDFSYLSDDEWRMRDRGDFPDETYLMYPQVNEKVHGAPMEEPLDSALDTDFDIYLRSRGPGADWCRYFILDPGHTPCAGLFVAVPPPELGDYLLCYDELLINKCTAEVLAEAVWQRTSDYHFQAFIIDEHGGRLIEFGSGVSPREQYSRAFLERGVKSVSTGHGFIGGSADKEGRSAKVRQWLAERSGERPKIRFLKGAVPHLINSLKRYRRQSVKSQDGVTYYKDTADPRSRWGDLPNTLEYAVAHGCPYVKPPKPESTNPAYERWLAYEKWFNAAEKADQSDRPRVLLGPRS